MFFDAAMQFIRENKGRPFFTYLALYNPHSPCSIPDPKWAEPYRGKDACRGDFFATIARIDREPRPAAAVPEGGRTWPTTRC